MLPKFEFKWSLMVGLLTFIISWLGCTNYGWTGYPTTMNNFCKKKVLKRKEWENFVQTLYKNRISRYNCNLIFLIWPFYKEKMFDFCNNIRLTDRILMRLIHWLRFRHVRIFLDCKHYKDSCNMRLQYRNYSISIILVNKTRLATKCGLCGMSDSAHIWS